MKTRTKYILGIVGLLAAIWVGAVIGTSPLLRQIRAETRLVQQLMDGYSAAMIAGRFDEAYEFCGTDYQEATSYDQFVEHQRFLEEKYGKLISVKRKSYKVKGSGDPVHWEAEGDWDFEYERQSLRIRFALRRESDRWVIFGSVEL